MTQSNCDLCDLPPHYKCQTCDDEVEIKHEVVAPPVSANRVGAVIAVSRRLWIGSGEDFPPVVYN